MEFSFCSLTQKFWDFYQQEQFWPFSYARIPDRGCSTHICQFCNCNHHSTHIFLWGWWRWYSFSRLSSRNSFEGFFLAPLYNICITLYPYIQIIRICSWGTLSSFLTTSFTFIFLLEFTPAAECNPCRVPTTSILNPLFDSIDCICPSYTSPSPLKTD